MESIARQAAYIERHLEPEGEGLPPDERLHRRAAKGEYDTRTGMQLEVDGHRVMYRFREVEYPEQKIYNSGVYRDIRDDADKTWREVTEASVDGRDVMLALPSGYRVFLDTEAEPEGGAEFIAREKAIRLRCGIETPMAYLQLVQAVGQAVADANDPDLFAPARSARRLFTASTVEVQARALAAQRKGAAFMLWQLRPFLSDDETAVWNRRSVRAAVSRYSLAPESELIRYERAHHIKTVAQRVGRAALLAVENKFRNAQPAPPTYESLASPWKSAS